MVHTLSSSSPADSESESVRNCTVCSHVIPPERVAALKEVDKCKACVLEAGDPVLRRHDEYYGTEGEHKTESFFMSDDRRMSAASAYLNRVGVGAVDTEDDYLDNPYVRQCATTLNKGTQSLAELAHNAEADGGDRDTATNQGKESEIHIIEEGGEEASHKEVGAEENILAA